MPPQAFGEDIDVPFISWVPRSVQLGTDAMAPPGALMLTPRAPSVLGPLDDHVYWLGGSFSLREYSATIMSGVTYAPTPAGTTAAIRGKEVEKIQRLLLARSENVPMTLLVVPPGQPTVERQGPLFPALDTKITLCFCTASVITSQILLKGKWSTTLSNSMLKQNTRQEN